MAHLAVCSRSRKPSVRSPSAAPSRGALRRARRIPLDFEPALPVRIVAHPELGVLARPDASAEDVARAFALYLRGEGHDVDHAALLPIARRRLAAAKTPVAV